MDKKFVKLVWSLACTIVFCNCLPVKEFELVKGWTVYNQNQSIKIENVEIPSGVYSAYSKFMGWDSDELLKSYNDINLRWISKDNWTYSLKFDAPLNYERTKFVNLTFYGLDTITTIKLNDKYVGETSNMFERYTFNVKEFLQPTENRILIEFTNPIDYALELAKNHTYTPPECPPDVYQGECHMNFLRKMQASFSWDWGLAAPSMGIWKRVTLEMHDFGIIRDVDVITKKVESTNSWTLLARVFLETSLMEGFTGELSMFAVDLLDKAVIVPVNDLLTAQKSIIEFEVNIAENQVQLWWPNGYGEAKLYHLHFTFKAKDGPDYDQRLLITSQKSIRIGFRTIELVQDEMGNKADGTQGYSFYFRVNNIPIFMKGANWIPSHILPEKLADEGRIKDILSSAKTSHMNMLRVWGGGIYESDYFYDLADTYGILIWQDMMFACAMYPTFPEFLESVRAETHQNALRLAHHASLALFAANNENEAALVQNWYNTGKDLARFKDEYRQLYVGTVLFELKIISDTSRIVPLVSSPTNGKKTTEDNYISENPGDQNYGDVHYYEYALDGWNPNIYPKPRFASEYGFQSFPSLSSWTKIMKPNDDLADLLDHRQHHTMRNAPIELMASKHLPLPSQDQPNYIEALIYFSQISQAMITRTETEVYRSLRNTSHGTMGALYWQLNDIWIAPSWSSIDYNGNYKILHHWAKDFLAPISIIAHINPKNDIDVFVVRDSFENGPKEYTATMNTYLWSELLPKVTKNWTVNIEPTTAKLLETLNIDDVLKDGLTKKNSFLTFTIQNENNEILSSTYYFPENIKNAVGITDPEIEIEIAHYKCVASVGVVSLAVKVRSPAVFVYLEVTRSDIQSYRFSRNGYIQLSPIETIHLEYRDDNCRPLTAGNINVLTVNQFMKTV